MLGAFVGLVLLLGLAGSAHARFTLSGVSQSELDRRALAVARDLESRSGELLLTNDIFGLHRTVNEVAAADPDLRYIVVFDRHGVVRADTFSDGLPEGLRSSNSITPGGYSFATLQTSEGKVRDLAFGIDQGRSGSVRIGFTMAPGQGRVNQMTANLLGLTAAVLVAGLLIAYWLATILTRPLSRLAEAARAVGRGEIPELSELYRHPEVGQVAVAFDAMTTQLREKEAERSRLLGRVLTAQEEERRRISLELHDEAGQALTSLMLGLSRIERLLPDAASKAEAVELRGLTEGTLELMRSLARDLRPNTLDILGLESALRRFVGDYGRRHGIETDFHATGLDGERMGSDVETALYRIAQEALTNVSRHAAAASVSVLLERRGDHMVMVIEDDGVGFQIDQDRAGAGVPERLGLLGMAERASLVGASLTVESRPGSGTAIFVEVPTGERK